MRVPSSPFRIWPDRSVTSVAGWLRRWRCGWSFVLGATICLIGAQAQESGQGHSRAQPDLDQFGRGLVQSRCKKPLAIKRERVPNPRRPHQLDVVWTTTCPGFEVVAFQPAGGRERPMQLTINATYPGLAADLAIGVSAAAVRARLGPPWSTQGDDLVYALDPDRPNDDTLTFRIEGGRVVELIWSWDTD